MVYILYLIFNFQLIIFSLIQFAHAQIYSFYYYGSNLFQNAYIV